MKQFYFVAAVFAFFLFFSAPVSAALLDFDVWSLEFNTGFGIRTGEIKEYVFEQEKTNGNTLSRLDWKTDALPYFTFGLHFDIINIIIDADFSVGIPMQNGTLDDWDFKKLDGKATNFSTHDLKTENSIDVNVKAGYKFTLTKYFNLVPKISILPQLGFMYRNTKYDGKDGYKQYASEDKPNATNGTYWNSSIKKVPLTGTVISYKQETYMPYINLEGCWNFHKDWAFSIFVLFSPYIWVNAYDDHDSKSVYYLDEIRGGLSTMVGAEIRWKLISVGFSYEYLDIKDGITGIKDANNNWSAYSKMKESTSGTDWSIWNIFLKVRI